MWFGVSSKTPEEDENEHEPSIESAGIHVHHNNTVNPEYHDRG